MSASKEQVEKVKCSKCDTMVDMKVFKMTGGFCTGGCDKEVLAIDKKETGKLKYSDLHVGDLILMHGVNLVSAGQAAAKSLKRLTVLPGLVSLASPVQVGSGTANVNHAGVLCTKEVSKDDPKVANLEMAHHTGDGTLIVNFETYVEEHSGAVSVWRLDKKHDALAKKAGGIADTWGNRTEGKEHKMHYALWKAFAATFRSSSFGPEAKKRAATYRAAANKAGGPAGEKTDHKGMYCSMFAIAVFQAATKDDAQAAEIMALDARHTLPMTLDGYIKGNSLWHRVGKSK